VGGLMSGGFWLETADYGRLRWLGSSVVYAEQVTKILIWPFSDAPPDRMSACDPAS
jgi:hypothetical protein